VNFQERRQAAEQAADERLVSGLAKALERLEGMLESKNEQVAFRAITVYLDRGLVWGDVDFRAGLVRVRKQLGRDGVRIDPKTEES